MEKQVERVGTVPTTNPPNATVRNAGASAFLRKLGPGLITGAAEEGHVPEAKHVDGGCRRRPLRDCYILASRGGVWLRIALDGADRPPTDDRGPVDVRAGRRRGEIGAREHAAHALFANGVVVRLCFAGYRQHTQHSGGS